MSSSLDHWIHSHRNFSEDQLRVVLAQKIPESNDYRGAQVLLARIEAERRATAYEDSERRHQESIARTDKAVRYARLAWIVSLIAVVLSAAGILISWLAQQQGAVEIQPTPSPSSHTPMGSQDQPPTQPNK